jgi:hypothetical protein
MGSGCSMITVLWLISGHLYFLGFGCAFTIQGQKFYMLLIISHKAKNKILKMKIFFFTFLKKKMHLFRTGNFPDGLFFKKVHSGTCL